MTENAEKCVTLIFRRDLKDRRNLIVGTENCEKMLRTFISHLPKQSVRSSRIVVQATRCEISRRRMLITYFRTLSTAVDVEVVPPPPSDASKPKQYSARVMKLVDEIANMTLVEVADLNAALKERLNLPDMPAGMPMMMAPGVAAPAAQVHMLLSVQS